MKKEADLKDLPRIWGDWNKVEVVDGMFYVILTTRGSLSDIQRYGPRLKDGMRVIIYDEPPDGPPEQEGTLVYRDGVWKARMGPVARKQKDGRETDSEVE